MGGQSSRRDGQSGRNDQTVGDGDHEGRAEQRYTQERFDFDGPDRAPATVDDSDGRRREWEIDKIRSGRDRPERASVLADADECRHAGWTSESRWCAFPGATPEGASSPLGEPSGEGLSFSASSRQGGDAADAGYWPPDRSYRGEWPAELEPAIRRVADGMAPWVDRLRLTGNGVVPLAAAVAFLRLRDRLMPFGEDKAS